MTWCEMTTLQSVSTLHDNQHILTQLKLSPQSGFKNHHLDPPSCEGHTPCEMSGLRQRLRLRVQTKIMIPNYKEEIFLTFANNNLRWAETCNLCFVRLNCKMFDCNHQPSDNKITKASTKPNVGRFLGTRLPGGILL